MLHYLFKPGPSETAEFSRRINIPSIGYEGESFSILGVGLSALDASQYRKIYSCFRTIISFEFYRHQGIPQQIFISRSALYPWGSLFPLSPQSMVYTIYSDTISSHEGDDPPHGKR